MEEREERRKGGWAGNAGGGFGLNRSAGVGLYFLMIFLDTVYPLCVVTRTT